MNKKIKIIELLNKRANGEKLPQKIKYLDEYYTLYEEAKSIENLYLLDGVRVGWFNHANFRLNTAVEIIEEQEEIDIQELEDVNLFDNGQNFNDMPIIIKSYDDNFTNINNTINKLVQAVKQLDKNIKEK